VTLSVRQKGLRGEQRAAKTYREAGWMVRRLDGLGDFLALLKGRKPHHVESMNQERLRLPEWLRQAKGEAPAGFVPVVVFPSEWGEQWACLPLADLVRLTSG